MSITELFRVGIVVVLVTSCGKEETVPEEIVNDTSSKGSCLIRKTLMCHDYYGSYWHDTEHKKFHCDLAKGEDPILSSKPCPLEDLVGSCELVELKPELTYIERYYAPAFSTVTAKEQCDYAGGNYSRAIRQ